MGKHEDGTYKLSVYKSPTSYLKWDGDNLSISGQFLTASVFTSSGYIITSQVTSSNITSSNIRGGQIVSSKLIVTGSTG